jgi:DNA primase
MRPIFSGGGFSERVTTKLTEYAWGEEVLAQVGIGSVASFDDYLEKLTNLYHHKRQFLEEIDLANPKIFSPDNLIFTVKDERGQPVGFMARNLKYEEQKAEYLEKREALAGKHGPKSAQVKALWEPKKYINSTQETETGVKNRIYQKGKRLFNFDLARENMPPLWVFEGNPDAVTAFAYGIKASTAICSTAFSLDHLNLVLNSGCHHIIFVLDADAAGEAGTERFVKMLDEVMGDHPGLRVEIVCMPDGSDDPDRFIRSSGVKLSLGLERMNMFGMTCRARRGRRR